MTHWERDMDSWGGKHPKDATVEEFLENAAAARPVPGGGGISALAGALAASMAEMVLNFTAGRKKYADVDELARRLLAEISAERARLLELVAEDGRAYDGVAAAFAMPRDTDEQKAARREASNAAMRRAVEPPLEVMRAAGRVAALLPEVLRIGNPNLLGDAGVAAALLPAAARAAALNVCANLPAFGQADAARILVETRGIVAEVQRLSQPVFSQVECRLCPNRDPDLTLA